MLIIELTYGIAVIAVAAPLSRLFNPPYSGRIFRKTIYLC